MKFKYFVTVKIIVLSAFILASPNCFAWGKIGHRVVASIAEHHLNSNALDAIKDISPKYSLAAISTWADDIKYMKDKYHKRIAAWHYATIEDHKTYIATSDHNDIVTGVNYASEILQHRSNYSKKEQLHALAFLVHFIADAHQPFHIGNGLDHGANDCIVAWFNKNRKVNLHKIWDSYIINYWQLSYSEIVDFIDTPNTTLTNNTLDGNITDWIEESANLRNTLYPKDKDGHWHSYCKKNRKDAINNNLIPVLGFAYAAEHKEIIEMQLLKSGLRLAKILNNLLEN